MCGSRKLCQRGPNSDNVFLVDEELEDPYTTQSGPSSPRQRNLIKLVFCWRADGGPTMNAGLVAWKKPYIFF